MWLFYGRVRDGGFRRVGVLFFIVREGVKLTVVLWFVIWVSKVILGVVSLVGGKKKGWEGFVGEVFRG